MTKKKGERLRPSTSRSAFPQIEPATAASRAVLWKSLPVRVWVEAGLCVITGASLLLTLLEPQWIEAIFGVDPDGGAGWTEEAIAATLAVAAFTVLALLRGEWRTANRKRARD